MEHLLEMAYAMMKQIMLSATLMVENAVEHVPIQITAPIALVLVMVLGLEYPMLLLEMVTVMMK